MDVKRKRIVKPFLKGRDRQMKMTIQTPHENNNFYIPLLSPIDFSFVLALVNSLRSCITSH